MGEWPLEGIFGLPDLRDWRNVRVGTKVGMVEGVGVGRGLIVSSVSK